MTNNRVVVRLRVRIRVSVSVLLIGLELGCGTENSTCHVHLSVPGGITPSLYLCLNHLIQNNQIRHDNTYGGGLFFRG